MRTTAIGAFLALALAGSAAADDDTIDITPAKDRLAVYTDGSGHYVVAVPFAHEDSDRTLSFYGDGKNFWQQRQMSYFVSGTSEFNWNFWEPRVTAQAKAVFGFKDKVYQVRCDDRLTVMKPLDKSAADPILSEAKFHKPRWTRRAYWLARDDTGVYYYVDQAREPENSKNFRVFLGKKGSLKQQKLKNIVSDKQGDIFSTKKGELRFVVGKDATTWIKGKKKMSLTKVDLEDRDNMVMIYTELGVYGGLPLGTPCDDL